MSNAGYPSAEDCYRMGENAYKKGFYLDAQTMFERACGMEPDNALYREARERLLILAFHFGKGGPVSGDGGNRVLNVCAEGCGECCCEACGEGCCEALCEGICGGCDCG